MPRRYSIAEARASLPTIIDQAEAGQEIELTRRGKAVVVLVSCSEWERLRGERAHFGEAYRRFLSSYQLRDVGVDDGYFSGARDRDAGRSVKL